MTTIEQLGGLTTQHNEIIKRVVNGSLNPISVKRALQSIIEGASKAPSVVERVEQQLDTWKNLGVVVTDEQREHILQQADAFKPLTASDEPLVTGGFGYNRPSMIVKKLYDAFTQPDGYTKTNYVNDVKLRSARGMKSTGGLRLVHYDPNAYVGLSPEAALMAAKQDKLRLAGIEALEWLVLNPQPGLTWDGKINFYLNLSGLQCLYRSGWTDVPCLLLYGDERQFKFESRWGSHIDVECSSPVVREC